MSQANVYHEMVNGVPLEEATSVPRGIIRIQHAKVTSAAIVIGIVSGAITVLCTDVNKYMPGCLMYDTSASVSNDAEVNIAASITVTPSWCAISNA